MTVSTGSVSIENSFDNGSAKDQKDTIPEIKVYSRRWIVLLIFVFYSISNLLQVIQYSVIADVIVDYYQVSYQMVDWSSMISSVTYVILSIPGAYMIDRVGIRKTIIVGIIGTTVGSWIKVGSVHPDRFWLVIFGQGIVSAFQICVFPLLPKLAATWFDNHQISTAVGFGCTGAQIGSALSFIIPPLIVWKGPREDVERQLYILNIAYAVFATAIIPVVFLFFTDAPPTPASVAQSHALEEKLINQKSLIEVCKSLLSNRSYMFFVFLEGMNIGVLCPIQVLSNQVILANYPDAVYDVGVIGLLQTFLSLIGSMGVSILLDKFKKFRLTCYTVYGLFLLSIAFYIGTIDQGLPFVYVSSISIGIMIGGIMTLGVEIIVEFTYPEPESVSVGIVMNWMSATSMGFTFLYGYIFRTHNILWANLAMLFLIIGSDLLFLFIKFDLRRNAVEELNKRIKK